MPASPVELKTPFQNPLPDLAGEISQPVNSGLVHWATRAGVLRCISGKIITRIAPLGLFYVKLLVHSDAPDGGNEKQETHQEMR